MTILQVTPEGLLEHDILPGEELHPRLNTIEARRFIGGLANGERRRFNALTDQDGNPDPEQQEKHIIKSWTDAYDIHSLAGHNTSRLLHSVRHFIEKGITSGDDESMNDVKHFYYPLLETPRAPFIADLHWDQDNRIRRSIGHVMATATDAPVALMKLPVLERGARVPWYARSIVLTAGRVSLQSMVQVHEPGLAMGSGYTFSILPEPAAQITRTSGVPSRTLPQITISVDQA